jgi:hypothetical protein
MKHILVVAFFLALSAQMGCGGRRMVMAENSTVEAKGILSLSVAWVKDKGKKYDIRLSMRNDSNDNGAIVYLHDLHCYKGALRGEAKHTFFNTGERTMDFKPGEMKTFNLVCSLGAETPGPMRISVARIYDNPSLDGKTVGKIVAKDLEWKGAEAVELK